MFRDLFAESGGNAQSRKVRLIVFDFIGKKMSLLQKFKKFYRASAENRIQIHLFLGFVIVPVIGMTLLYIFVKVFWL